MEKGTAIRENANTLSAGRGSKPWGQGEEKSKVIARKKVRGAPAGPAAIAKKKTAPA